MLKVRIASLLCALIIGTMPRPAVTYRYLPQSDIELIARITWGEANNQSEYGQRLVIDSILNRLDDEHFPNTVSGVIFAEGQFATAKCAYNYPLKDEICQMVREEMIFRTNYDVCYFNCGGYNAWSKPLFQEGDHYFGACIHE